jgi:MFS family permease
MMSALFVVGLDVSVVNIMLPQLQDVFGTTASSAMLVATVYLMVMGAFQLSFGRCADLLSSEVVFFSGVLLFFLGSMGCAMAPAIDWLILGRAVQALGGAMLSAAIGGVVLTRYPREQMGSVLGSVAMVLGIGTIVGPPLGGYLAQHLSWRWAFGMNLPFCLLSAALLLPYLRKSPLRPERLRELDLKGAVLSVIALLALPGTFSVASELGWQSPAVWATALVAVISLALFLMVERRVSSPLLSPEVMADPHLRLIVALRVMLYASFNGLLVVFPFFLTGQCRLSGTKAGTMMLGFAATMAFGTRLFGGWVDRYGSAKVMAGGALAVSLVAAASHWLDGSSLAGVLLCLVSFAASLSAVMVASSVHMMGLAPKGQEGVFSALNFLMSPVGGALGVGVFSYLWSRAGADELKAFHHSMLAALACAGTVLVLANQIRRQR